MVPLTSKPPFQMSPGISQSADGAISGEYSFQVEVFMYLFQILKYMKCNILVSPIFHLPQSSTMHVLCTVLVKRASLYLTYCMFGRSLNVARVRE